MLEIDSFNLSSFNAEVDSQGFAPIPSNKRKLS